MKRLRIYMRDKFRCQYCGEKKGVAELTLDHILPRSRGGDNSPVNIVTACIACNNRKSNRTPEEARMPLLTSQSALRVKLERVVLCHYAEARAEWRKYLFMDVHDDRDVMEKVHVEQRRRLLKKPLANCRLPIANCRFETVLTTEISVNRQSTNWQSAMSRVG